MIARPVFVKREERVVNCISLRSPALACGKRVKCLTGFGEHRRVNLENKIRLSGQDCTVNVSRAGPVSARQHSMGS